MPHAARMTRLLAVAAVAALFASACATGPRDAVPPSSAAPAPQTAGLTPAQAATAQLRIYDVADLAKPAGDPSAVSDLTTEMHAAMSYEVGDADPEASIAASGTTLVVRARPATHAWMIARLTALRGR